MALVLTVLIARAAHAEPPRVVQTIPADGDEAVKATLSEIRIVFDQAMQTGANYSIVGGGPSFPKVTSRPRWLNDRTIVFGVQLEANHEYELSINSERYTNFKNEAGETAVPYALRFRTVSDAPAAPPAKLTPELNAESIEALRQAIDERYSYRDLRGLDWKKLIDTAAPRLLRATSAEQFAKHAAELLGAARDIHILVQHGQTLLATYQRTEPPNYSPAVLPKLVPGWTRRSEVVYTGRINARIGYIFISSFSAASATELEAAVEALREMADLPALIVDVRANNGGDERLAWRFAGCFIDQPKVYAQHVIRDSSLEGGFTRPFSRVLQPNADGPKYRGRVAVLIGPRVLSSAEAFVLMMKQAPDCTLVGMPTFGSSGNPQPVALPNGVTVYLPVWKAMRPDGSVFEGEGIAPDVVVETKPADLRSGDPVLERAIAVLSEPK